MGNGADRPLIGITKPERGDNLAYLCIKAAIYLAGGRSLRLTTGTSWRDAEIDGLIIGGGADVFPEHYGQMAIETAHYDHGRDEMEMYWARQARDRDLPTLAICRGAQLMNVASGGSLHHNLEDVYGPLDHPTRTVGKLFFRKVIDIKPESRLAKIFGATRLKVNSFHERSIADVGYGLKITAQEMNGIVQGIEDPDRKFYMGVQFHPEFLIYREKFLGIFKAVVEAAGVTDQPSVSPSPLEPTIS